jgi:hypothetical protein
MHRNTTPASPLTAERPVDTTNRKNLRQLVDPHQVQTDERWIFPDGRWFKSTSIWIKLFLHPVILASCGGVASINECCRLSLDRSDE